MNKLLLILFSAFLFLQPVSATILEGQNKDYAGKKIDFFRYTDPVTQQPEHIFTIVFDADGNFKAEVKMEKTTFAFSEFGIYRGILFLEPEKTLNLLFPPPREKTFAEQKNPFFEPVSFWFVSKNHDALTDQISDFDKKFNELTDKYFNRLYFRQSKAVFDTITRVLNKTFPDNISATLAAHKKLKLKSTETDAFRLKTKQVASTIELVAPKFWNDPAFVSFLDKTFSNQLSFQAKNVKGEPLQQAVAQSNTDFLLNFVNKTYNLQGAAAELALLKMLHDGFYSGEFPQNAILKILHSPKLKNSANKTIRKITENVIDKLEFLMRGTKAPVICLHDIDGYRACSDRNPEKFKYLIFVDTEMIVCREQLKYLPEIVKKFDKYLDIIIVLRKTDLIEMKIFLDKQKIPGLKLIDEGDEYIDKYRVKSFPECFLLDENHKVVFPHAKAPLDGFEQQFGSYLRQELFKRQRNQAR